MNNNPFEYMNNFMNYNNFFKNSTNPDPSEYLEMLKKNIESFGLASSIAHENLQSLMKDNAELWQKTNNEMYNSMKNAISSGNPDNISSCQKKYFEDNIENTKKALEMSTKSWIKVLDAFKNSNNTSKK